MEINKSQNGKKPADDEKTEKQASYKPPVENTGKKKLSGKDIFAGVVAIVLVLVAGGMLYISNNKHKKEISALDTDRTDLYNQLNDRDQLIDDMVSTFNQIEKDLQTITEKENYIEVSSNDAELIKSKKNQVIDDIKLIGTLLEANKKKIRQLNAKIKKSGLQIASLESKLSNLEKSIMSRDSSITVLRGVLVQKDYEIADLSNKVSTMTATIEEQKSIINYQVNESNKAYLTSGNFKELKEKGVLEKDGGFLWIGQEVKLQNDLSDKAFKEIDIFDTKSIPVNSKKAELITSHPSGSYYFVTDSSETIAYLEIKDPYEFWKRSKYAVLETK